MLCIEYLEEEGVTFATLGEACWALDSAKREIERRIVNPYEDKKLLLNGDVFQEDGDVLG
jgi:hypothetical protein